jgi:Flp pilus assembly pilin Flp
MINAAFGTGNFYFGARPDAGLRRPEKVAAPKGAAMIAIIKFLRLETGEAAVEYGLLLALVVLVVVGSISFLGIKVRDTLYNNIAANFPGF